MSKLHIEFIEADVREDKINEYLYNYAIYLKGSINWEVQSISNALLIGIFSTQEEAEKFIEQELLERYDADLLSIIEFVVGFKNIVIEGVIND